MSLKSLTLLLLETLLLRQPERCRAQAALDGGTRTRDVLSAVEQEDR